MLGEVGEEVLLHDRAMGAARGAQALAPAVGETRVGAARVVFATAAPEQLVALQAIHQARETAARKLCLLGEIAHAHATGGRVDQVLEHLIGAELQPVLALQATLQALGKRGVRAQQAPPRT